MKYIRKDGTEIEFITVLENDEEASIFRHFKKRPDNIYKIVTIALDNDFDSDTNYVIYQKQDDTKECFVREVESFFEKIDTEKYPEAEQEYRMQKIL